MDTARRLCWLAVPLLVMLSAGSAHAGDVLDLVPDDAVLAISVQSLEGLEEGLGGFADTIYPGASEMVSEMLMDMYTFQSHIQDGMNRQAPAAMMLLLQESSADELQLPPPSGFGAHSVDRTSELQTVMALPLADERIWRQAMGVHIAPLQDSPYEEIIGDFGPQAVFTIREGFLVAADTTEALDLWSEALSRGISPARRAKIENALTRAPLAAQFSMKALLEQRPEALDFVDTWIDGLSADEGMDARLAGMAAAYGMAFRDFAVETESITCEVMPSYASLRVAVDVDFFEGSLLGNAVGDQRPVDLSSLEMLPGGSVMFGVTRLEMAPLKDYLNAYLEELSVALGDYADAGEIEAFIESTVSQIDDYERLGLHENSAFAFMERAGRMALLGIYESSDPDEAVDLMIAQFEILYGSPMGVKLLGMPGLQPGSGDISDETISGRNVKVIRQPFEPDELDETEAYIAEALEALLGNPMVWRLAAAGDRVYTAFGDDDALMRETLQGAHTPVSSHVIERSLAGVASPPSCAFFVSVPDVMLFGMRMSQVMMGELMAMPAIDLPSASRLVAGSASFSGTTARFELNVPAEQINLAQMALMPMMMMHEMPEMNDDSDMPW